MSQVVKKGKETMSIAIAVSLDGSSKSGYKIVMVRSDGSGDIQMKGVSIERDGMICIPVRLLSEMFSTNGQKATEETKENGND